MERKQIVIFGGCFNPPLNSHFSLAQQIINEYENIEKNNIIKKVKIGISPQNIDRAVLHCDLLEDLCLKK